MALIQLNASLFKGHLMVGFRSVVQQKQNITHVGFALIWQDEADKLLKGDILKFEQYVSDNVKVELDQGQFDALVAWTFNLGPGNLRESTMLKKLNKADYTSVPNEMKRWNKAGGKTLDGLIRRRNAEALLFQSKEWHQV